MAPVAAAAALPVSSLRSKMATDAPPVRRAFTVANPSPEAPPVTTAASEASIFMRSSPLPNGQILSYFSIFGEQGGRMTQVMKGIRVLEVAQFTFVPAAGAILADWGADVIKVEHPVRGDAQRGFINIGGVQVQPDRHQLIEHPNRGKRSLGIDVWTREGHEL